MCEHGAWRHHHEGGPRGPRHHWGEGRGHHPEGGPPRGRGGRARRGEARFLLLDALKDAPRHGYEIIRAMEERSGGEYTPSPGTVYPTLQYLEDLGWVRADQEGERRVYQLTDAGRAELTSHAEEVKTFWERLEVAGASAAIRADLGFLRDEMQALIHTIRSSIREGKLQDNAQAIREIRQAVQQCHNQVRDLIAGT